MVLTKSYITSATYNWPSAYTGSNILAGVPNTSYLNVTQDVSNKTVTFICKKEAVMPEEANIANAIGLEIDGC